MGKEVTREEFQALQERLTMALTRITALEVKLHTDNLKIVVSEVAPEPQPVS